MQDESSLERNPSAWGWHLAALVWSVYLVFAGLLTIFRTAANSSLAKLIEFKDIPILFFFEERFGLLAWLTAAAGLLLAAAAVYAWRARPDRTSAALACATCVTVGCAILGNRYWHGPEGELLLADPGRLTPLSNLGLTEWVFLVALIVTAVAFMRSMERGLGTAPDPRVGDDEHAPRPDEQLSGVALVYLLSVGAVVAAAVWEHLRMWSPEENGGFNYVRFLAEGELRTANMVLFSTSLLVASLAGVGACGWWALHRLSARDREREAVWQAVLIAGALATVTTIPWMARLSIEIKGEDNWFFVPAVIAIVFGALVPAVFVAAYLAREDFARGGGVHLTRGERGLLSFCLFPLYPLLRLIFTRRGWITWALLMALACGVLAGCTWGGYQLDSLYGFEDWRGMFKKSLFPVLRVAVSVGAASALVVLLHRLRLQLMGPGDDRPWLAGLARAGRWALNVAAVACLAFATWPFWGWDHVSRNVLARTVEFSGRHDFERRFLQWLLDFDGDGYATLLQGGDPDDRDPLVQAGGIGRLHRVKIPQDEFRIVDPAKARAFPNLVFLFLEGTTPTSISGYGLRSVRNATPGMDGVLRDGAHFTHAYCTYPSTWDGWFATISGRQLCIQEFDTSVPFGDRYSRYNNLHKVLKAVGINRWCYPDVPPFRSLFLPDADLAKNWENDFHADPEAPGLPEGTTKGELRAKRMVRFLESIEPGQRFFMAEHLSDAHFPWARVPDAVAKRLGFEDGLSFVEQDAFVDGQFIGLMARYYHNISRVDAQVQMIVRALKRLKLYDKTLFVIESDHGCQWYEHEHAYYVSHLYQQSIHLPLIMKFPGKRRGVTIDAPVLQMDVLPTIMELAGVASSRPLYGHSVASLLDGAPPSADLLRKLTERDMLLKTHYDTLGVLSRFREKLIYDRPTGTYLLFDLVHDPQEMVNLADRRPDLLAEMLGRLRRVAREHMVYLGGIEPSHHHP